MSIFGKAIKGFGMLKKSKDSKKPLSETWSHWDEIKKMHRTPLGVPGTDKAKKKIASDFVKVRKKTKPAWQKKKLHPIKD